MEVLIASIVSSALTALAINFVYACVMLRRIRADYPLLKHPPFWTDFWQTFFGRKE